MDMVTYLMSTCILNWTVFTLKIQLSLERVVRIQLQTACTKEEELLHVRICTIY